jgi:hypothetical protein
VFVKGTDTAMWQRTWDGAIWKPYASLGGVLNSDPGAISWSPFRIDVFVRGADGQLWHRYGD